MTPEDRKQAFANEYNELVKKYGVVIVAKPNNEQMSGGEIVIKLPTVDLAFVDNWQPEAVAEPTKDTHVDNPPVVEIPPIEIQRMMANGHKEKA